LLLIVAVFGSMAPLARPAPNDKSNSPPGAGPTNDGGRKRQVQLLRQQGNTYELHGQYDQALEAFQHSRTIARDLGDTTDEGAALNCIGNVLADMGQSENARRYYEQALKLARDARAAQAEAAVLDNLGYLDQQDGQYQEAMDSFQKALAITRRIGSQSGEQAALAELGSVAESLGQYGEAIKYDQQAIALARSLNDSAAKVAAQNNLASAYADIGQYEDAIKPYETALELDRKANHPAGEVAILSNLAGVYAATGRNDEALRSGRDGLTVARNIRDLGAESSALNELGNIYSGLHQYDSAADAYEQSLAIVTGVGNLDLQGVLLTNLMGVARARGQTEAAIFFGKEAVDQTQRERGAIRGLERKYRLSYLRSKATSYRNLADLLLSVGRIDEALQVLSLLKDEEYREFTGGESEHHGTPRFAPGPEESARHEYDELSHALTERAAHRSALMTHSQLAPAEKQELAQADLEFHSASGRFHKFLGGLAVELSNSKSGAGLKNFGPSREIMAILAKAGPGNVAVYTLVGDARCWTVLITPDTQFAASYPVTAAQLHDRIVALQMLLAYPAPASRDLLADLYQIVAAPLVQKLGAAHATTIAWSLDGDLRYIPIGALYDGKHYLIERYSMALLTRADAAALQAHPDIPRWRAVGLGTSNEQRPLPDLKLDALTNVPAELCSIVKASAYPKECGEPGRGIIPGTIVLNRAFNRAALADDLNRHNAVVHIASHYVFGADDRRSFLLLGDGSILNLRALRLAPDLDMTGVQLLTLSACETASIKENLTGSEVDSLAETLQARGAEAVLASLWRVDDESTRLLMVGFYHRMMTGRGRLPKAAALREAQLALIRGDIATTSLPNRARFANPYYWAPFILIGNWL
jgi:CHAT domain-containing protein/Flp pilus assembly protein TadD